MSCENVVLSGAKFLGCYSHCNEIALPILACQTGIHTITANNKGLHITNNLFAVSGESFTLKNIYNEMSTVEFSLIQPDGTLYTLEEDENCYSSFWIKVVFSLHAKNELDCSTTINIK